MPLVRARAPHLSPTCYKWRLPTRTLAVFHVSPPPPPPHHFRLTSPRGRPFTIEIWDFGPRIGLITFNSEPGVAPTIGIFWGGKVWDSINVKYCPELCAQTDIPSFLPPFPSRSPPAAAALRRGRCVGLHLWLRLRRRPRPPTPTNTVNLSALSNKVAHHRILLASSDRFSSLFTFAK